mgnify:CR=1 FL=1
MKQALIVISIFIFNLSFGQVENYDLLTKNIELLNVKSITKIRKSRKFPDGEKKFKLEFNRRGQLVSIEEYEHPMGPDSPMVMRQEIRYNEEGRKVSIHIEAPGGSTAIDTLFYDSQNIMIKKQRIVKGKVVRTWNYSNNTEESDAQKEFDRKDHLVKLVGSNGDSTIYNYYADGNLSQELEFKEGEEHTKCTFQYDKDGRLTSMETYLLYIGDGTGNPLVYYFEYEEYK